ncbi:hypothetical protein Goshw_005125 [Gossypium schwendimanii]|uniref:Dirigent protein n=1 Tax=Gossypium schwendimanii TaxID=34291 RepID=A0A7J9MG17_GOSSC|nr:hypothetical protein [Gossypium schwendimanii]
METYKLISILLSLAIIAFSTSARMLDEQPSNPVVPPVATATPIVPQPNPTGAIVGNPGVAAGAATGPIPTGTTVGNPGVGAAASDPIPTGPSVANAGAGAATADHPLIFFMHDILGGSNPTAIAITGVVNNPAVNGQLAFPKPNGANLPVNNGVNENSGNNGFLNNNNIPLLSGLGGNTQAMLQNGNNNGGGFPALVSGQVPAGSTLQKLMFGTMTVIDDELTIGHELTSGFIGKAQGFYVASSVDGTSHTMAFTAMFESGHYADTLSFFGVHRTGASESHLAIMGGTGKYVNSKGFAIVRIVPASNQTGETDGFQTVLEFNVYLTY